MRDGTHEVFLGLGTNMGDRTEQIRTAVALIGERIGNVTRQSSVIETEPWGFESSNKFLNAVVCCETTLTPHQLLGATQQIERDMGRTTKSAKGKTAKPKYTDRPIDIDILLYDDITLDEPDLKIPHPLMLQRDFVMIPLREIRDNR